MADLEVQYLQVQTTTDSRAEAMELSRAAVESRLAACAQVAGPVASMYWWDSALERTEEWLILLKLPADRYDELAAFITERHSYDEPEIIALPIVAGSTAYLNWMREETRFRRPRPGRLRPAALSFDRYRDEIVTQTSLLTSAITGADLTLQVPTCPDWNAGELLRHLGGAQRWAAGIVRSRAGGPVRRDFTDLSAYTREDPVVRRPAWLAEGAAQVAAALREAGPGTPVWTPIARGTTDFYARRFTHETLIHRADAALAVGAGYQAAPDVAVDAIDEWLYLGSLPIHLEYHPEVRELLGPGRTLHFHATDTPPDAAVEWVLLVLYRRRPAAAVEVLGDAGLLDLWLDRAKFG